MAADNEHGQALETWAAREAIGADLAAILFAIAEAGARLRRDLSRQFPNAGIHTGDTFEEKAPALPEYPPRRAFCEALAKLPITFLGADINSEPRVVDPAARLGLVIDPLASVSHGATNTSFGIPFSVLSARADNLYGSRLEDIQTAAGFLYYGPQTWLVVTCGSGSFRFLLHPEDDVFYRQGGAIRIPAGRRELAINTSNYRFWEDGLRYFIDDCIAGESGPMGQDFALHWQASPVAAAYRILVRGGVFLYPGDTRQDCGAGCLRLLYDALPLAFVIEQAGGMASDGLAPILQRRLASSQERVPLIFGCNDRVDEVIEYLSGAAVENTRFPLFENRSLFRN